MTDPVWRPAVLGTVRDGRLGCELCPFGCTLAPGQHGLCRVRRNHGGELQTATFSVAARHLDAIERKPFYHVRPGTSVLTTAAPGCTFRCGYCVNHRLSQYGRPGAPDWLGEPARPAELVAEAAAHGVAVGLSYTEPGLAPELTLALAEHAAPAGVPILWKSNGFLTPAAIDLVAPALLAVNIDVKAADDDAHRRLTGAPLAPVLDAIGRFRAAGVWVEVSTPLVPGTASDPADLRAIAGLLAAIDPAMPWHLLRFTPDFRMAAEVPTLPAALDTARMIGREAGLRFVYVERALGPAGRNTACPRCENVVVERGIWNTVHTTITGGRCPRCALPLPGHWR
ncbi:MAG: radical SAM protein [Pseudonocardiales bacterium]|nr:radical SAM protein [Pseudonocardiales bacterium]